MPHFESYYSSPLTRCALTANLPYTIYQTFFQAQDYGLAAAMGVVVVLGTLLVSTFALRTMSSLLKEGDR